MATSRKPQPPELPPPARLTCSRQEAERLVQERIAEGETLRLGSNATKAAYDDAWKHLATWSETNSRLLRSIGTSDEFNYEYSRNPGLPTLYLADPGLPRLVEHFNEALSEKLRRLRSFVSQLPFIPEEDARRAHEAASREGAVDGNKIFIVHGRNEAAKQAVARFVTDLGLTPVVLAEQPSRSATVIEKLEKNTDVAFAVVLLTSDDIGKLAGDDAPLAPRARQNVVFELGYFIGRLGRERVCAFRDPELTLMSDIDGVVITALDAEGAWKLTLAKELRAARIPFDANALIQ